MDWKIFWVVVGIVSFLMIFFSPKDSNIWIVFLIITIISAIGWWLKKD